MKISIYAEPPKAKSNLDKVIKHFSEVKQKNSKIDINYYPVTSVVNSTFKPKNNEIIVAFGRNAYINMMQDIKDFYTTEFQADGVDLYKFSFFVNKSGINYFIAFMPPIDITMEKLDTKIAFESMLKSLDKFTNGFTKSIEDVFTENVSPENLGKSVSVIKNGMSAKTKLLFEYSDIKSFIMDLFDKEEGHRVCIDTETSGLNIFGTDFSINIMSFCFNEPNFTGYALDLGLPGIQLKGTALQRQEIKSLLEQYIFEKKKVVAFWNASYDVFAICNYFKRSLADFLAVNTIIDGPQILHVLTENRKFETYKLKSALRDYLNWEQYDSLEQYLDYLAHWESMSPVEWMIRATQSLSYAAKDSSGTFQLIRKILTMIKEEGYVFEHYKNVTHKILLLQLMIYNNGIKVDTQGILNNIASFAGWEGQKLIMPILKNVQENTLDGRLHAKFSLHSAVNGKLYFSKPDLNKLKVNTNLAKYFKADDGHTFVYVDLKQAEFRMLAYLSQDDQLIKDICASDYYSNFAKYLFNKEEINERERKIAKEFILTMINLGSEETISENCGVTVDDAKMFIEKFYEKYPKTKQMTEKIKRYLNTTKTMFGGSLRKRRFSDSDLEGKMFFKTFLSAHNHPISSTVADMVAMKASDFVINNSNLGVKACNINHDSVTFQVPDERVGTIVGLLKEHFSTIDSFIENGVKFFRKEVVKNESNLIPVIFDIDVLTGKDLGSMEETNLGRLHI